MEILTIDFWVPTLQSVMNAKLNQHRFWPFGYENNSLIKWVSTIRTPQPICEFQVSFPLVSALKLILVYPNPQ